MARPRQVQPATLQGLAGLNEIEDDAGRGSPGGRVYALLRRAIVNIDLAPGTALNEVAVAESLGVSRIPIREAFRKLMAEGLVEIQPQKGTFISRLRRSQLQDALFDERRWNALRWRKPPWHPRTGLQPIPLRGLVA
ncbi:MULTISPECIES: GntR family transcriptional regulator [Comamonas]|uniref:GntR family transcriptional regulator n=1 Tax=Comamonas TaxID=283 RepID=UPI0006B9F06B|nr:MULTISPECIES: GntR family transcriptional regulator [Comamonas]